MMNSSTKTLKERVRLAGKFQDNTYYLKYCTYTDLIIQVHSIVETNKSFWLRGWRGQKFGPENYADRREKNMFRINEKSFKRYVVPPDQKIGKAIEIYGKRCLLEIEIYDDHKEILNSVKSGDFVALQNVHIALDSNKNNLLIMHGGCGNYNRGISLVPIDFDDEKFQELRKRVENALDSVQFYKDFVEFQEEIVEPEKTPVEISEPPEEPKVVIETKNKGAPPCKRITIGENIMVDRFPKSSNCKYYFLTHGHSDHCVGLNKNWDRKIYCSEETALILPILMGYKNSETIPDGLINPLKMNIPHEFDGFEVTLIDANHCPGAVMFVFEGDYIEKNAGGSVLCTGDFRADEVFLKTFQKGRMNHWLTKKRFSIIYLDNTYLDSSLSFPSREKSFKMLIETLKSHQNKDIYIPLNRLGREELLQKLSENLSEPISVYEEKMNLMKKLGLSCDFGIGGRRKIIGIKRNGWDRKVTENSIIVEITMLFHHAPIQAENVIKIPYSDHCSRNEILNFLAKLHFKNIVPISKAYPENDLKLMLLTGKICPQLKKLEKECLFCSEPSKSSCTKNIQIAEKSVEKEEGISDESDDYEPPVKRARYDPP